MKTLLHAIRWDFIRQFRYNIAGIMFAVTLVYMGLLYALPFDNLDPLLIFLIFNDPTALGMLFVGSLILFEKSEGTLSALEVTPLARWKYLWSKAISLTLIAIASSLALAMWIHGISFNAVALVLGVGLTSVVFVFIGIGVVKSCRSFNEYIIWMAIYFLPFGLPLLNFLGVTDSLFWYVFPTQATFVLLEYAFGSVLWWEMIYALVYLLLWVGGSFYWALRRFKMEE